MIDINKVNKKDLTSDIIKNASILVGVHLLTKYLNKDSSWFDEKSVRDILIFLTAVAFYHVVVVQVVSNTLKL